MEITGHVQNGIVVLDGGFPLPEGAVVIVSCPASAEKSRPQQRVQLPLVRSDRPGNVRLTADLLAELREDDHVSARR